jgi:hypothetical protein
VRQIHLGHAPRPFPLAPFTQNTNGILAIGHAINDVLREQRTAAGDFLACSRNNTRSARILIRFRCPSNEKFIILSRKDRDFTTWRLLKSNTQDVLSVVNFSTMSYCSYNDRSLIFVENQTPIANAKPHAIPPFEALHIPMPGGRKLRQAPLDATAHVRRELRPLARARRGEGDWLHVRISRIAILKSRPNTRSRPHTARQ